MAPPGDVYIPGTSSPVPPLKKGDKIAAIERDERVKRRSFRRRHLRSLERLEEMRLAAEAETYFALERRYRRSQGVLDGEEYLGNFLQQHFEDHIDQIRIISAMTLAEIKMIGNEENQAVGVSQCRRLFNAPVLNDQIGYLLWCELRQGEALDHTHDTPKDENVNEPPPPPRAHLNSNNPSFTIHHDGRDVDVVCLAPSIHSSRSTKSSNSKESKKAHAGTIWRPRRSMAMPMQNTNANAIVQPAPPISEGPEEQPESYVCGQENGINRGLRRKKLLSDSQKKALLKRTVSRTVSAASYFAASLASGYCL
ncbi:hypothetical protein GGR57DRAFT_516353 [Xylariaceae sp. FL1272]|nr:hypothetical protein GGR57DRAFT_516353 [Xylariaceae sp. FL1272]